jgi:hypothetical protein
MLEPVIAGIFAWIWINETWNAIQLIGGATVIAGIYIAKGFKPVSPITIEVPLGDKTRSQSPSARNIYHLKG